MHEHIELLVQLYALLGGSETQETLRDDHRRNVENYVERNSSPELEEVISGWLVEKQRISIERVARDLAPLLETARETVADPLGIYDVTTSFPRYLFDRSGFATTRIDELLVRVGTAPTAGETACLALAGHRRRLWTAWHVHLPTLWGTARKWLKTQPSRRRRYLGGEMDSDYEIYFRMRLDELRRVPNDWIYPRYGEAAEQNVPTKATFMVRSALDQAIATLGRGYRLRGDAELLTYLSFVELVASPILYTERARDRELSDAISGDISLLIDQAREDSVDFSITAHGIVNTVSRSWADLRTAQFRLWDNEG